jgi:plastocyanin
MPHRPRALVALAIAGVFALGAAGCGSSSDSGADTTTAPATTAAPPATTAPPSTTAPSTTGAAPTTVAVEADPGGQLAFVQKSLSAPAGEVTFVLTNASSVPHDLSIEKDGADLGATDVISGGATAELTVDLEPGTYEFYCSVGDHESAGMAGTLTVS